MESVLRQTLTAWDLDDPLNPGDVASLRDVARRHAGQPFALEPVVIDLVEAMLFSQFRVQPRAIPFWHEASVQIAQTLFDDPVAQERLQALWQRLSEAEQ